MRGRTRRNVVKAALIAAGALVALPARVCRVLAQQPSPPRVFKECPLDICIVCGERYRTKWGRPRSWEFGYDPLELDELCSRCCGTGTNLLDTPQQAQSAPPQAGVQPQGGQVGMPDLGAPCFLRGTLIRTAAGERQVEALQAGDFLPTLFGGLQPIRALRVHRYLRRAGEPWSDEARPVLVCRSALGDGVPRRDLWLTGTHALFVDGVLIPAADLVNGTTIRHDDAGDLDRLDYFHIELDGHDVVEAEGAACESLLDRDTMAGVRPCAPIVGFNGGRSEAASRLRSALSPLLDRRRPVDVVRDRLEERAIELATPSPF